MRTLTACIAVFIAGAICVSAQTRTTETTTSVDSSSGRTTTTYSTTIKSEEDVTPRSSMIVINPLKFFLFYNLSYFHRLSNVIVVGGGLQTPTPSEISGFGVNAEVRFHPSGRALRGFYIAPNISYNNLSGDDDSDGSVSVFSIGALAGWQWFPGDDFAIGLGIGVDHYSVSATEGSDVDFFSSYDGLVPALRFDLGYAW